MKNINFFIFLILSINQLFSQEPPISLVDNTWKIEALSSSFQIEHISYYHKDSVQNGMDLSSFVYQFFEDGSYTRTTASDELFTGLWAFNVSGDSLTIDSITHVLFYADPLKFIVKTPGTVFTDELGNADTIYTYLTLFNSEAQGLPIAGTIAKENQERVSDVKVQIADKSILTGKDGRYTEVVLSRQNYTIKPSKIEQTNNGVSISDILQIQSHIIGRKLLDSPYKMIAADVNNSGTISTSDILAVLDIVLGNEVVFRETPSWQFVPADFEFLDPSNPFASSFPDSININDLSGTRSNLDFVAIKMGDVNLTSSNEFNDKSSENRANNNFKIEIQDQKIAANTTIIIPIKSTEISDIHGYQLGLAYNHQALELLEVIPTVKEGFSYKIENGIVKVVWMNKLERPFNKTLFSEEPLLQLRFRTKSKIQLFDALQLSKTFSSEIVMANFEEKNIQLIWENIIAKPLIVKAFPNPVKHQLQLTWTTNEASSPAQIEIFNSLGQNVLLNQVKNTKQTILNLSQLANGSYFIRVNHNGQMGYTKFIKEE